MTSPCRPLAMNNLGVYENTIVNNLVVLNNKYVEQCKRHYDLLIV